VKGEPDIRGWDVKNGAGQKIGEVEDLIIDAQQKKVRYMVVELDDDDLDLEDDKKVLIPIGLAELHKEDDDVLLTTVTIDQLKLLPAYDRDNLEEETEHRICSILGRKEAAGNILAQTESKTNQSEGISTQTDDRTTIQGNTQQQPAFGSAEHYANFYQHDYFNDDNLYRHRLHESGKAQDQQESDYERGLRLWEMRSEGGIIPGDTGDNQDRGREVNEEKRLEMVRNRRKEYETRRGGYDEQDRSQKRDNSIEARIKREGLRDA
jgi:hypothetical protein